MNPSNHKGYTLIEVLIALAVFAILATITSTAMVQAFDARKRVNAQADQLVDIQLAITIIEHDTEQVINRSVMGNEMHVFPPFVGQPAYLEFARGGLVNPDGVELRSTLKRIAYVCANNQLLRRSWEFMDAPMRQRNKDKVLLANLDECSFAYLTHSHQVLQEWRPYAVQQNQKQEDLPTAIKFSLTIHNWGNMSLLFAIPEAVYGN